MRPDLEWSTEAPPLGQIFEDLGLCGDPRGLNCCSFDYDVRMLLPGWPAEGSGHSGGPLECVSKPITGMVQTFWQHALA